MLKNKINIQFYKINKNYYMYINILYYNMIINDTININY